MSGGSRLFRNPWWIVFGSVLGLAVGNGPIMQFAFAVFLKPVTAEFSADRGMVSAALSIGLCCTGLCTPVVGRLVDRFGIVAVTLPAITLFALATAALGILANSAAAFLAIYALMGVFAAGQTPLPYAKSVSSAFDAHRGLALGVAMAGVGIGTALLPLLSQTLIAHFGWRTAYVGLAILLFVVAFPSVALFLREGQNRPASLARADASGMSGTEALRCPAFWTLAVAFFFVALACAGMLAHIVAILTDRGMPALRATAAISAGGLALIVGRLLSGWLLDRLFAPYVASAFFVAPLAGIAILFLSASPSLAIVATALIGVGLGAEVDLIAFLISRYLGLRCFGEIYGYLFLVFMLGSGIGPSVMGFCFARTGNYTIAMTLFMAGLATATLLILRLGAYRYRSSAPAVPTTSIPLGI